MFGVGGDRLVLRFERRELQRERINKRKKPHCWSSSWLLTLQLSFSLFKVAISMLSQLACVRLGGGLIQELDLTFPPAE